MSHYATLRKSGEEQTAQAYLLSSFLASFAIIVVPGLRRFRASGPIGAKVAVVFHDAVRGEREEEDGKVYIHPNGPSSPSSWHVSRAVIAWQHARKTHWLLTQ